MFMTESEKRDYALKPMNCPGHILIFKQGIKSYRDLPLRYGEFGQCHRNEPTGGLHGIMRVRGFTQDDGHIFCTEDQILGECTAYTALLQKVYKDFGFDGHHLQGRDAAGQAHRLRRELGQGRACADGKPARARAASSRSRRARAPSTAPRSSTRSRTRSAANGSAARCRSTSPCPSGWTPSTSARTAARHRPVMLHRAIVGSLERFIGILIEQHAGALPAWLAPVQVAVLNITDAQADYAREVAKTLQNQGLRVELDLRNEKITYKIREHSMQKLPYILVVGDKEKAAGAVAVRARGNQDLGVMPLEAFSQKIAAGHRHTSSDFQANDQSLVPRGLEAVSLQFW